MDTTTILIIVGVIAILILIIWLVLNNKKKRDDQYNRPRQEAPEQPKVEVKNEHIEILAAYVKTQKEQAEEEQRIKDLKRAEQKSKLEVFKQTKEQLKDKLKNQLSEKDWRPLDTILKNSDKGGVGIYLLFNESKNKYYIGQAKQLFKRVRDHFSIEEIARDYLAGDSITVKFLTANELDSDYRIDHIEKTAIEIFNADKSGYNKTNGNL